MQGNEHDNNIKLNGRWGFFCQGLCSFLKRVKISLFGKALPFSPVTYYASDGSIHRFKKRNLRILLFSTRKLWGFFLFVSLLTISNSANAQGTTYYGPFEKSTIHMRCLAADGTTYESCGTGDLGNTNANAIADLRVSTGVIVNNLTNVAVATSTIVSDQDIINTSIASDTTTIVSNQSTVNTDIAIDTATIVSNQTTINTNIATDTTTIVSDQATVNSNQSTLNSTIATDTTTLEANKLNLSGGTMTGGLDLGVYTLITSSSIDGPTQIRWPDGTIQVSSPTGGGGVDESADLNWTGTHTWQSSGTANANFGINNSSFTMNGGIFGINDIDTDTSVVIQGSNSQNFLYKWKKPDGTIIQSMAATGRYCVGASNPSEQFQIDALGLGSGESALAFRQSNASAYGFDWKLDIAVDGHLELNRVVNHTDYEFMNFDRSTGYVAFSSATLATSTVSITGNLYVTQDVSALTFTDRTPYPKSTQEAYDAINSIQSDAAGKGVDHSKLHSFVKSSRIVKEVTGYKDSAIPNIKDPIYKDVEIVGRNVSATVSALVEVIKDLKLRIEALEKP